MTNLLVRLKQHRVNASPAERELVDCILADPQAVSGLSIHELAEKGFASPSTITRMCKKIGLDGYREFQRLLIYDLASLKEIESSKIDDLYPTDTTKQTLEKVTANNVNSLRVTETLNSASTYDACVDLMAAAHFINLYGMGASLLTAHDLHYKLLRIGVTSNLIDDWHGQLLCASNSGPQDLSIAISYSGATREVIRCAKSAKERGGKIIAITGSGFDSELVHIADETLFVASGEPLMRSAAMASRIGQLGVIDVLFKAFVNRNYKSFLAILERNQIPKC